jgi:hypothetical protein
MQRHNAFHWPDHVIGKRESRRIREEHNALYNDYHEAIAALKTANAFITELYEEFLESDEERGGEEIAEIRAAIEKAVTV